MIRVIQVGLGPLGRQIVGYILDREGLELVGAVDSNPDLVGRDAGEVCGLPGHGLPVEPTLDAARLHAREVPQVAVLATVSSIEALVPQVEAAARAGLHIVSTCEELTFPWKQHPKAAAEIDALCRAHGVACVGTGVNPGFLMDYLPAVLTSIAQRVDRIEVERVQDAAHRRIPFQKKIGAGLTPEAFEASRLAGTLRHVGLPESVDMIAHALGWELDAVTETLEPVLADRELGCGYRSIAAGMPAGVRQVATATIQGREVLRLTFRAAVGEPLSYDRIRIHGVPELDMIVEGGVNGDVATCAIAVNAVHAVVAAEPGLRTMLELPVPAACGTRQAPVAVAAGP